MMRNRSDLLQGADEWISIYDNADHLRRTADYIRILDPDASLAVQLAGLTHDMERAYPGPDRIDWDARKGPADPEYHHQHAERSARIVAAWLLEQGATEDLIARVSRLVAAHEFGGWPEADLLEAADCVSYLEVNVDLLLGWLPTGTCYVGPAEARAKIDNTLERIKLPRATELARPLHARGLERVASWVALHKAPASTSEP